MQRDNSDEKREKSHLARSYYNMQGNNYIENSEQLGHSRTNMEFMHSNPFMHTHNYSNHLDNYTTVDPESASIRSECIHCQKIDSNRQNYSSFNDGNVYPQFESSQIVPSNHVQNMHRGSAMPLRPGVNSSIPIGHEVVQVPCVLQSSPRSATTGLSVSSLVASNQLSMNCNTDLMVHDRNKTRITGDKGHNSRSPCKRGSIKSILNSDASIEHINHLQIASNFSHALGVSSAHKEEVIVPEKLISVKKCTEEPEQIDTNENKKKTKKRKRSYLEKKLANVKECFVCHATETPLWRYADNKKLCNRCGIYFNRNGSHRPIELQKRKRETLEMSPKSIDSNQSSIASKSSGSESSKTHDKKYRTFSSKPTNSTLKPFFTSHNDSLDKSSHSSGSISPSISPLSMVSSPFDVHNYNNLSPKLYSFNTNVEIREDCPRAYKINRAPHIYPAPRIKIDQSLDNEVWNAVNKNQYNVASLQNTLESYSAENSNTEGRKSQWGQIQPNSESLNYFNNSAKSHSTVIYNAPLYANQFENYPSHESNPPPSHFLHQSFHQLPMPRNTQVYNDNLSPKNDPKSQEVCDSDSSLMFQNGVFRKKTLQNNNSTSTLPSFSELNEMRKRQRGRE